MIAYLSSLSTLFVAAVILLLVYAGWYYRSFRQGRQNRYSFPVLFGLLAICCLGYLAIQFRPPLLLNTFDNTDHYFIRHDGFQVDQQLMLGVSDTAVNNAQPYSKFLIKPASGGAAVVSDYSEEPFFITHDDQTKILSKSYPATEVLQFSVNNISVSCQVRDSVVLRVGTDLLVAKAGVRRGISLWSLFQDQPAFIQLPAYREPAFYAALRNIFLLRAGEELSFFFAGRFFAQPVGVTVNGKKITQTEQSFNAVIPTGATISWGIGNASVQRNQYHIVEVGKSLLLKKGYPVSYPLARENKNEETAITKFLLAAPADMTTLPPFFREGFMFSDYSASAGLAFAPMLLTYSAEKGSTELNVRLQSLADMRVASINEDAFKLPAESGQAQWVFSLNDTTRWQFATFELKESVWLWMIIGSLLVYIIAVMCGYYFGSGNSSFIGSIMSMVCLVFLSTRFFLYWRYKTFPPFEGIDLPSRQQLESPGNFFIIVAATLLLALFFAWPAFRRSSRLGTNGSDLVNRTLQRIFAKGVKLRPVIVFIAGWVIILIVSAAVAWFNAFDPGLSRHIAIGLLLLYFIFLYIAYRHSPLTAPQGSEWWQISSGRPGQYLVSNPLKIFLSVSLLATFLLVDIGFAIVFLNFILFNEAFLLINYGIGGLSAGSLANARRLLVTGVLYLAAFILNLLYAPHIFNAILDLPHAGYYFLYLVGALVPAYVFYRLAFSMSRRHRKLGVVCIAATIFGAAALFFRKEVILDKASMTRYRIDVLLHPAAEAVAHAYEDGKTFEPVIRAAQNQWFINTFIDDENNPGMHDRGFQMLPHAPQNKGARYNAQATDLVTSRFLIAEHGKSSALLYVFLLLIPGVLIASFYKLYPDFTNRTNQSYPAVTAGFAILNYLIIASLLVTLAATGRYIFFGQDLPFASILSKQSILFPALLIIIITIIFSRIPAERYRHRLKFVPGLSVLILLAGMLIFVKPVFNKNKQFNLEPLSAEMSNYVSLVLEPIMAEIDTTRATRRLSLREKDLRFTDSLSKLVAMDAMVFPSGFIKSQVMKYLNASYENHLNRRNLLSLDVSTGSASLAVNENYFRVDAPPHLQQLWTGNVYSDTTVYNISAWDPSDGKLINSRLGSDPAALSFRSIRIVNTVSTDDGFPKAWLVNDGQPVRAMVNNVHVDLARNDSIRLTNPCRIIVTDTSTHKVLQVTSTPDAFMHNYFVNGSRYYVYPLAGRFNWARNFAEGVSPGLTKQSQLNKDVFVSMNLEMTDSLLTSIHELLKDTAFKYGAEYGVAVADGLGRIIVAADDIKGFVRPDPNDKTAFSAALDGEEGVITQSMLRKQIGNINFLRLNPGPGSTLKPIVFAAIASQLNLDWSKFSSDGFTDKQDHFGGEKVAPYDFEKNNGRINNVIDYFRYSDNYYHSNVILLGSYRKQDLQGLLQGSFSSRPLKSFSWPYFSYSGKTYWLNDFSQWPGFFGGRADFGSDSSFASIGLWENFSIANRPGRSFDAGAFPLHPLVDAGPSFITPERPLFDQSATGMDHRIPYDIFLTGFRGHVKGSSQVMISPATMMEGYGRIVTLNRNYRLSVNPFAEEPTNKAFAVDASIQYNAYMELLSSSVFKGMQDALYSGTAAALGSRLKNASPYFYYAKTGTTGDDEKKTKSKLLAVVISKEDITSPAYTFRGNKFYTVYFTSQNGPTRQNEEFQAKVIKMIEASAAFKRYMRG